MTGFFTAAELKTGPKTEAVPRCSTCGLYRTCKSPKMPVYGVGNRGILVVGESPGKEEDDRNRPFVGKSGTLLRETLGDMGVDLYRDCWTTNTLRCRPPRNATPTDKQIDWCRPYLIDAVRELKPSVILLLGSVPVKSLIGWLWKEDPGGISRWVNYCIPNRKLNAWICPAWHPSFVLRQSGEKGKPSDNGLSLLVWKRQLKLAISNDSRPWTGQEPDTNTLVTPVYDPAEVVRRVKEYTESGKLLAFDLETNGIKPESPQMKIHSCAISDGETAIAYPWHGRKVIAATRKFLCSSSPKTAHNGKFDARWLNHHLGVWVKNLVWDTMLATHVMDNRQGTKSLKFQSFVMLGEESYDDAIKPYLKSSGSNEPNRIAEAPLKDVLIYNAMDTLLTVRLAKLQASALGVEL